MQKSKRKKSEFYHVRYNKVGINQSIAAEILEVEVEQVKQWDIEGAPRMAIKLLLLWDRKHVNWHGWDGWLFSRNRLLYKRKIFRPETILTDRQFRENLENEAQAILNILNNTTP